MGDPQPSLLSTVADWSTLVGLGATLAGFAIAIKQILLAKAAATQAKTAAEAASEAAKDARSRLLRLDCVVELTNALRDLDDFSTLHRQGAWDQMPERYLGVRRTLHNVKTSGLDLLTPAQQQVLQSAIGQIASIGNQVEKHIAQKTSPSVPRLNFLIARESDGLAQLVIELKLLAGAK